MVPEKNSSGLVGNTTIFKKLICINHRTHFIILIKLSLYLMLHVCVVFCMIHDQSERMFICNL